MMLPLTCREIRSEAEREAVYRLRYAVYVEEMGRSQSHADREARRLGEPLDESAIHLGAFGAEDARLLGALRIHLVTRQDLGEFPEVYSRVTAGESDRFAVVTRLVSDKASRGGPHSAGLALAIAAYRRVLGEGIASAYIDCSEQLAPLFAWLGFDVVEDLEHPTFGSIAVMRIGLHDTTRLERSGSPLLEARASWLGECERDLRRGHAREEAGPERSAVFATQS